MDVLVTGAAGFIGAAVAEVLLQRGDRVLGIDNFDPYYSTSLKEARCQRVSVIGADRFELIRQDFADMAGLEQALAGRSFDRIVHLGAQPGVRYSLTHPHAYSRSNLVGHLNILEIARAREVEHLVYASSSSVYGGNAKLPFAVEDRVDHPLSLYAATKKADELMSETYAHLFRLPVTGLRFFTVYGPWGRPDMMVWRFTERVLRDEPIPVYNGGEMMRDFTYIDDIVAGVINCLDAPPADDGTAKAGGSTKPHALYNIGNNRSEPVMKMIGLIEEACGRRAQLDLLPMQPGDVTQTHADITAISRDHGFAPTTPVEIGVPNFVNWYRAFYGI
ncbi:MAG: protein CapI [Sphingomonadales bacterium 12-68-11]|nr:MAG: protein CapI [Sphingomonadales bacterium 12-68-11]